MFVCVCVCLRVFACTCVCLRVFACFRVFVCVSLFFCVVAGVCVILCVFKGVCMGLRFFGFITSGSYDKQAIQRGAEQTSNSQGAKQTSNSARRGTYKQFAVPLEKQATAFLTNLSYRGKNFQRCWINQQDSFSQPYLRH